MPLATGSHFDRYEILGPLGAGGMGEVYLAQDSRLGRRVALKLLPERFTHNPDRVRRFEQEARAASALSHPCIMAIYDVGQAGGVHYSATEYVEGQTLRELLATARPRTGSALDIAIQTASALAAAHEAGIVHRDVKPENVMVRPDGYVKVLDFGLAKLTEAAEPRAADATGPLRPHSTQLGIVLGTPFYMSPEQARGLKVDARSDVFSLGAVLYEMLAGQKPFEGPTSADVLAAILDREPPPLSQISPAAPAELARIVAKALEKDKQQRYQVMLDMLLDLKRLKQQLDLQAELARATPADGLGPAGKTLVLRSGPRPRSRGARAAALAVGVLLMAGGLAWSLRMRGRPPLLTDRDTILIADFDNRTGDSVFDGTLRQGLAVQLQQSPFLSLFPDARVRQTLRLMGRPPEAHVSAETAREICERQGLKALIAGSIASLGRNYVITLEAVSARTGDVLAGEQVEAEGKEAVLKALGRAASALRQKLGESLGSIQAFDAPLELTTSSLEALRAFSLGMERAGRGRFLDAIPLLRRAVELDPEFAYAWAGLAVNYANTSQPALAAEYAARAFALKDRASELEKLRIAYFYYSNVTGELDEGIEVLELYRRTYPRDARAPINLADARARLGEYGKAAAAAREALAIDPQSALAMANLAWALVGAGRFDEAREVCERGLKQNPDSVHFRAFLYQVAFVSGDAALMDQQIAWAAGQPDEYAMLEQQAAAAAFRGQARASRDLTRRALERATAGDVKGVAAQYAAAAALRAAALGLCPQGKMASQALALERNQVSLAWAGLALAVCGETATAQAIADELASRYPKDTVVGALWLPTIVAAIELHRGDPGRVIELLQPVRRYEGAAEFWPQYLRGRALLRRGATSEAVAEFRLILDQRGQGPCSPLYPLAHAGLAIASGLGGEAHRQLLALWKGADTDLPALAAVREGWPARPP